MNSIQSFIKKVDWYSLVAALAMLLLGLTILIWPAASSQAIAYVAAALLTLFGLIRTILYFSRREKSSPFSFGGLSLGLSLLLIGVFLLLDPAVLIGILPVALGCLLIFSGFGSLQTAIELMRLKIRRWYIPLIFAFVAIICGFLALLNPFRAANVLMVFLGVALIGESVLLAISILLLGKEL